MPYYPTVKGPGAERITVSAFRGLNYSESVPEGAFSHTVNLSSEAFPVLSTRRARSQAASLSNPGGMTREGTCCWVDGGTLYVNGAASALSGITPLSVHRSDTAPTVPFPGQYWYSPTGKACKKWSGYLWEECAYPQKQLVRMGAYLCIFPDGLYYNLENPSDRGSINAEVSVRCTDHTVSYTLSDREGTALTPDYIQSAAPAAPAAGETWLDTSMEKHTLRVWSQASELWVENTELYIRLSAPGLGAGFRAGDGVTVSGIALNGYAPPVVAQAAALNGGAILSAAGQDYIVIPGILDMQCSQEEGTVTVSRIAPEMDWVCECRNRLWGCKYGFANGRTVNELYCSKLGDIKNWQVYAGLSTDSWAASVGADGPWTGAASYLGSPVFFKEERLFRITVSSSGGHGVTELPCRGVASGSGRSLAVAGELLYYLSPEGVCIYDGSVPECISGALGERRYRFAAGGGLGERYYISMQDRQSGQWGLYVYDGRKRVWMREDDAEAASFFHGGEDLLFQNVTDGKLISVAGRRGTAETGLHWEAVTGPMGYETPDRKYLSRILIRARTGQMKIFFEYDSSGVWIEEGSVSGQIPIARVIPVRPRRCDHVRMKLTGEGEMKLFSVSRIMEEGSDV